MALAIRKYTSLGIKCAAEFRHAFARTSEVAPKARTHRGALGLILPMSNLRDLPAPSICHREPMLATPGKLFSAKGWIFELKHDGFRCLITKYGDTVRLESRTGRDMSSYFPEVVDEIRPIRADFVADSEFVVLDEQGQAHLRAPEGAPRDPEPCAHPLRGDAGSRCAIRLRSAVAGWSGLPRPGASRAQRRALSHAAWSWSCPASVDSLPLGSQAGAGAATASMSAGD